MRVRTPGLAPLAYDPVQVEGRVVSATGALVMPNALADTAARLESLLALRSIPFAMKLFANRAEMEAIPRIRRPSSVHTLDQVVAQAARLGWTVGVTAEDLVGAQSGRGRTGGRQGCGLAVGQTHERCLVLDASGRRRAPSGDALR